MTRQDLIDLITVRLTAGQPSDDFTIDDRQIGDEIDIAALKLLNDAAEKIKVEDTYECFILRFDGIAITKEYVPTNMDGYQTRYYIQLPCQPVTIASDLGIRMVETSGGSLINRAKLLDKKLFCRLPFSKENMTYNRLQDKLYLENITDIFAKNGYVNVVMTVSTSLNNVSDTEGYPLPTYLQEPVIESVRNKLAQQLGMTIDHANDGSV